MAEKWKITNGISAVEQLSLSIRMIQMGIRPILVHSVTKVPVSRLVSYWNEVNKRPSKGQLPQYASSFLSSKEKATHAAAYLEFVLHVAEQRGGWKAAGNLPETMMDAYHLYLATVPGDRHIKAEHAFYIWRDYRKGYVHFPFCSQCGSYYIHSTNPDASSCLRSCPYCKSIIRAKKKVKMAYAKYAARAAAVAASNQPGSGGNKSLGRLSGASSLVSK